MQYHIGITKVYPYLGIIPKKKSFLSAFLSKRIWTFSQMVFTAIVFYRLDGGGWDRCNIHGCNSIRSRYLPLLTWEAFITFPFCYSTSFSLIIAGLLSLFIFFDVVNIKLNICKHWKIQNNMLSLNLEYWGKLFTAQLCGRYFDNTMMKEHHFFLLPHLKL